MGICSAKLAKFRLIFDSLMAKFTTSYLGQLRCANTHTQSGTLIHTDAPSDNMGKGEAFSPTDLCALSLTTCIVTTMGIYAQSREFSITSIEADTWKHMATDPRRIAKIEAEIRITLPPESTDRQREGLRRVVHTCPVSKSLHPDLIQDVRIVFAD